MWWVIKARATFFKLRSPLFGWKVFQYCIQFFFHLLWCLAFQIEVFDDSTFLCFFHFCVHHGASSSITSQTYTNGAIDTKVAILASQGYIYRIMVSLLMPFLSQSGNFLPHPRSFLLGIETSRLVCPMLYFLNEHQKGYIYKLNSFTFKNRFYVFWRPASLSRDPP